MSQTSRKLSDMSTGATGLPVATWLLSFGALGALVLVQGNLGNLFPHERSAVPYFESSYWVGIPKHVAMVVTALQSVAAAGYFLWARWAFCGGLHADAVPHALALLDAFLVASFTWPFASYLHVRRPQSVLCAIVACAPLFVAALAVVGMTVLTFVQRAPALPTTGVLLLGTIVVLADGVGWTSACVARALTPA